MLFVGNSLSSSHDLPNLVCRLIQFQHPERKARARLVSVSFLEDVAKNPACRQAIESGNLSHVVLQAQKISRSGRYHYSLAEGIDVAKLAKSRGLTVFFFSEWGLRDDPANGPRHAKIYGQMADAAGVGVAPVGRAWELALADRPDLPLHDGDGNHQSALGAFLTACVLAGRITGESPAHFGSMAYQEFKQIDLAFLAGVAAKALANLGEHSGCDV